MEAADGQWSAVGGDIVGFLGVDNPRANANTLLVLQAVSSFVVNQLGKQREEQQRMMLSALTDDYDVLIRSDLDLDTFAVLRTNDSYLLHCPELYSYRSLSASLDRLSHLNEEETEAIQSRVNPESIIQHLTRDQVLYHNFKLTDPAGNSATYSGNGGRGDGSRGKRQGRRGDVPKEQTGAEKKPHFFSAPVCLSTLCNAKGEGRCRFHGTYSTISPGRR